MLNKDKYSEEKEKEIQRLIEENRKLNNQVADLEEDVARLLQVRYIHAGSD